MITLLDSAAAHSLQRRGVSSKNKEHSLVGGGILLNMENNMMLISI